MLMEVRRDANMQRLYVHEAIVREHVALDEFVSAAEHGDNAIKPHSPSRGDIYNFMASLRTLQAKGASKVIDENGEPLVVYHGTSEKFTIFEPGYEEPGSWFTSSYQTAGSYAKGYDGDVLEVFLNANTPFVADFSEWNGDDSIELNNRSFSNNINIVEFAEKNRNDSVHFPVGNFSEDDNTWVVFEPTQIKSATGNNGNFDPNNSDIRFSRSQGSQGNSSNPFAFPDETPIERAQRLFQDDKNRWTVIQNHIKNQTVRFFT